MNRNLRLALSLILFVPIFALAQSSEHDDFGIWGDIQATKNWDKFYVALRAEGRSNNMSRSLDCWYIRPIIGVKPLKWLKIDAAYDFLMLPEQRIRHDFLFSITGTLKKENLSVSLRERYMMMWIQQDNKFSHALRSYLIAQYQIGKSPFAPYLAIEMFTWDKWQKTRHYVGTEIKVSEHSSFDIAYMYYTFANKPAEHLIVGGFHLKW